MGIVAVKGAGDFLIEGLIAGSRIAAMASRNRQLKADNQISQQRLQLAITEQTSIGRLRELRGDAATKEAQFNEVRTQKLKSDVLSGAIEKGVPVLDEDFTDEEATAFARQIMEGLGVEITPANLAFHATQAKGFYSRTKQSNDIEKLRAQAFAISQAAIAGTRATTEQIQAAGLHRDQMNTLFRKEIDLSTIISTTEEGKERDSIVKERDELRKRQKELRDQQFESLRDSANRINRLRAPRLGERAEASGSGSASGSPQLRADVNEFGLTREEMDRLPLVTTQEEFNAVDPGENFKTPDGQVYPKPK